jgi:hypothetical protein
MLRSEVPLVAHTGALLRAMVSELSMSGMRKEEASCAEAESAVRSSELVVSRIPSKKEPRMGTMMMLSTPMEIIISMRVKPSSERIVRDSVTVTTDFFAFE